MKKSSFPVAIRESKRACINSLIEIVLEGREKGGGGGGGGRVPNPISQQIFFFQIPQSQPLLLNLKSHSHFSIVFVS